MGKGKTVKKGPAQVLPPPRAAEKTLADNPAAGGPPAKVAKKAAEATPSTPRTIKEVLDNVLQKATDAKRKEWAAALENEAIYDENDWRYLLSADGKERLKDNVIPAAVVNALEKEMCDPIDFLATQPTVGLEAPPNWNLAYPLFGTEQQCAKTVNIQALRNVGKPGGFDEAEKKVLEVLKVPSSKGPLIIGVQAGMGMGKSHAIDIADRLLFVGDNPLLLKVSYGFQQNLDNEIQKASKGFFARLVLALHQQVSPGCAGIVAKALEEGKKLTAKDVAAHVLSNSKSNQPIIVGVDEIGTLDQNKSFPTAVRSVLSAIAEFIKEISSTRQIIALVTALPSVDIHSLSSRPPIFVTALPLSSADAMTFLKQQSPSASPSQMQEMVALCGGHPRSLAIAAHLFNKADPHVVPAPNTVAEDCFWKVDQGSEATVVRDAIKEAYHLGDSTLHESMKKLNQNAMMMKCEGGRFAVAPTVLWSYTEDKKTLFHLRSMFACRTDRPAAQALEYTNIHWDLFRACNELSVIPPSMKTPADCTAHRFCFDPTKSTHTTSILHKDGGFHKDFDRKIDETTYYLPEDRTHRAFESMCVAKPAGGGKKTLCIFQSKINNSLTTAINNLNVAAGELRTIWKGKILFVIFALESKPTADTSAARHPLLLVTEDDLDNYFTPTLAAAAKLCLIRRGAI